MNRLETPVYPGFGDRRGWLTVHTLSEFVFCPRAGAIAYANQQMDEVDLPPPRFNLDYLPDYSLALIEEALDHQLRSFRRLGLQVLAAIIGGGLLWWGGYRLILLPIALLLLRQAVLFSQRLSNVLLLAARRRAALAAQAREPVRDSDQMQKVNWWELLRAGYESEAHELVLEDESLQLAGRPWRVLSRGSLRIPVVKALTPAGDRSPLPKPQHAARVAAYCRLLSQSVGGESPFGIVIFGSTYEGSRFVHPLYVLCDMLCLHAAGSLRLAVSTGPLPGSGSAGRGRFLFPADACTLISIRGQARRASPAPHLRRGRETCAGEFPLLLVS
ncbi:MAG: hypothetical protein KF708_15195 [Pirellulales bacterium]|nr:hypothetical protein [Pirellulales bacterium]